MRRERYAIAMKIGSTPFGGGLIRMLDTIGMEKALARLTNGYDRVFSSAQNRASQAYFDDHAEDIGVIRRGFCDDLSREVYDAALAYRSSARQDRLRKIRSRNREYFDPDVYTPAEHEYLVDCGACTGDTMRVFVENFGPDHTFYAVEMNLFNIAKLREYVDSAKLPDAEIFPVGVWDRQGKAAVVDGKRISCGSRVVADNATEGVNLDTIDNLFTDKPVSFIKMDIEGAEQHALNGAWNVIWKNRPKLAICLYHSDQDMVEIPIMLMTRLKDYRFSVRHYSDEWYETILYAMPLINKGFGEERRSPSND